MPALGGAVGEVRRIAGTKPRTVLRRETGGKSEIHVPSPRTLSPPARAEAGMFVDTERTKTEGYLGRSLLLCVRRGEGQTTIKHPCGASARNIPFCYTVIYENSSLSRVWVKIVGIVGTLALYPIRIR